MTLAPSLTSQARCATPEGRELVDAAFGKRPARATRRLTEEFCSRCPIWRDCLQDAMATGEHGPWGGTGRRLRTRAGAPRSTAANLVNVVHPGAAREPTLTTGARSPSQCAVLLSSLDVNPLDIQHWAVAEGLIKQPKRGLPRLAIVEAYLAAHDTHHR